MAQTYKFGKDGTWATKKGSTLAYSDTNNAFKPLPFSFERNSIATRVNKEGLIEVVGNDIPRIDYTDNSEGALLLENSATNVIINSEDFTGSEWSLYGYASGDAPILISNYDTSPDGKQNATRLQFNLNGGTTTTDRSYIRYNSFASQTDYYYSCYVKSANGQEQKLLWQHGGDDNEFTVTNEWQRVELDRNGNAETFTGFSLRGGISTVDSADVLIWGFQVERNSVASSYIPTNGSTVQRAAETCNDSANSEVFNDNQGVLFANISSLTEIDAHRTICLSDGSISDRINIWYWNDGTIKIDLHNSNNQQFEYDGIVDTTLFNKIAIKYKVNDFSIFLNGFEVFTDLVGTTPIGLNKINFSHANELYPFFGKTKEIAYYDEILTDEQLEYMTSYRSLNEMVTELNLNAL